MTNLPSSWALLKIVDVLVPNENGKPFQQGWSPQCEKYPAASNEWGVLKTTAIQEGEFWGHENKKLPNGLEPKPHLGVKNGDILMTCAGPRSRCGVTCFVKHSRDKLMISGKMYRFRCDPDLAYSQYLEHFLHSRESQYKIDRMKTGINDSGLNLTHGRFSELDVPLAPKNEQHRIVAKIEELFSELDKGVESLKAARAQLKIYRQAVLKHAFEGKLTAQWREENKDKLDTPEQLLARIKQEREARYEAQLEDWKTAVEDWESKGGPSKKPTRPKPANDPSSIAKKDRDRLPHLPDGWAWIGLAQLFSTSPQNGVYKPAIEYGSGTQIIRIDDFYDGQLIRRTGFKKLRLSIEEIEKYKIRNLDLIINRVNSIELLGKCALVDSLTDDTVFESNIMKCCVIEDVISKSYVASYLASHEGRNRLCENAKHAVNQASINQTDVGNTLVPITSMEEQLLIVKKIEQKLWQADALILQIQGHLKKAEALRQSILKRAFSGQLVAQDPGDELASVLLDRIKAEKEQTCKSIKTTKKTRMKRKRAA